MTLQSEQMSDARRCKVLLRRLFVALLVADLGFLLYAVAAGFPLQIGRVTLPWKDLRTPSVLLLFLGLGYVFCHPGGVHHGLLNAKERLRAFAARPFMIWLLLFGYGLLFTWQQVTEYFSVSINFIPFGFYDYMLYYFFQGKINYTGALHGYYHANNILYLLAPFWYVFKSPWVLILSYGFIAAAAGLPLYGIARERLGKPGYALLCVFLYFNYRYLQNVLLMNFAIEIFYPLCIFSAVYFALRCQWLPYYAFVLLGCLVKEDSFLYFVAVGALVFCLPRSRKHGLATITISLCYFFFLVKIFLPATGNTIWERSVLNFVRHGRNMKEVSVFLITHPMIILQNFFGSMDKLEVLFQVFYRLAFLPFLSPTVFLSLAPLAPLFLHATGRDVDFYELHFHYAAPVLPFIFIALVFGASNLYRRVSKRTQVWWSGVWVLLLLLNTGNYRTNRITAENLASIQWARRIPSQANVVTHGHLLPYLGYRKYNYYFALPWEREEHPWHNAYANADYYLIDFNVNLYPLSREFFMEKLASLKEDPRYELIHEDANQRYLFKRKANIKGAPGKG